MAKNSKEAQERAEAAFTKKEHQAREGAKAVAEYEAEGRAVRAKTERLRALRLAKEAADAKAETEAVTEVKVKAKKEPAAAKKKRSP